MTREGRYPAGAPGSALVSASSFGLSGSLGRGLMDAGWSSAAAVAVRILLGAAVLMPLALMELRGRWVLLRRNLRMILAYGLVAVAGCQLAYFNAIARMPVGVALLIEYAAPVAIVGWLWLTRGQRPGRQTVAGALLGIVGLVLVLDLVGGASADVIGVLWAFGAMIGVATYFVLSARQDDGLPPTVLAASGLLIGGVALLVAGATGVLTFTATTAAVAFVGGTVAWWVPVVALGVLTAALSYATGIARHAQARLPAGVLRRADRGALRAGLRLGAARRGAAPDPAAGRGAGADGRDRRQVGRAGLT